MATLTPNKDAEVTIQEAGNLTRSVETLTFAGTGEKKTQATVPTGKIWILKGLSMYYAGTFTATNGNFRVWNTANAHFDLEVFAAAPTAGLTKTSLFGNQDLQLPEGWKIGSQSAISADTNGNTTLTLLYKELDA